MVSDEPCPARRVKAFSEANPDKAARIIRCGIGDMTESLPAFVDRRHARGNRRNGRSEARKGFAFDGESARLSEPGLRRVR